MAFGVGLEEELSIVTMQTSEVRRDGGGGGVIRSMTVDWLIDWLIILTNFLELLYSLQSFLANVESGLRDIITRIPNRTVRISNCGSSEFESWPWERVPLTKFWVIPLQANIQIVA
jgi:hypothetical protein